MLNIHAWYMILFYRGIHNGWRLRGGDNSKIYHMHLQDLSLIIIKSNGLEYYEIDLTYMCITGKYWMGYRHIPS